MKFNVKHLMTVSIVALAMIGTGGVINASQNNVQADAEPQFNEKALSNKTWHQTPAANNINDVHIIKFNSKIPVGEGYYVVEINGKKFNATGDSKLGQQIKAHQRNIKETQIKKQKETQKRIQQTQQKAKKAQEKKAQHKLHKKNRIKKNKNNNKNKAGKSTTKTHKRHYGLIAIIIIVIIALLGWIIKVFTKSHHNN